jgi:hypothetical protein
MQTMQNHYKIFTLEKRHQRQEIQERHFKFYKKRIQGQTILHQRESNTKLIPELYGAPLNLLDSH